MSEGRPLSNSERARAAFRKKEERERADREPTRAEAATGSTQPTEQRQPSYQPPYRHSWQELVRAGLWLSVGALIVFPIVMFLVGVVLVFILGAIGYSL
jgi:hypothetical protein